MKGFDGKTMLTLVAMGFMCLGVGTFFTTTTGVFFIILGFGAGFYVYYKYGRKPIKPGEKQPLDKMDRGH